MEFAPQRNAHIALSVDDVAAARAELEAKGVGFFGEILDSGVCHMAFFRDPDGNDLMLHHRYARQVASSSPARRFDTGVCHMATSDPDVYNKCIHR